MIWLALIIPVVLSGMALLIWGHKLTWWEMLLPIVVSIFTIFIMKIIMVASLTSDTEYLSEYIVKSTYYEAWNEYIHRTCTRTVSCGKGCTTTQTYDCSYVDYHPKKWELTTNSDRVVRITEPYWLSLVKKFNNKTFKDMHRHYHSIDGDAYYTKYPNDFNVLVPLDFEHNYDNRIQTNQTVFYVNDINDKTKEGLFDYDKVVNLEAKSCLGCSKEDNEYLRKLNALNGKKHQIHILVLVFSNQKQEIAERQRLYWKGGNKNELIICVDKDNRWAKAFSWSDDKWLETWCSHEFMSKESMHTKLTKLNGNLIRWKRKEFADFKYIKVQLSLYQIITIFVVTFIVSIAVLYYGIFNDINQED